MKLRLRADPFTVGCVVIMTTRFGRSLPASPLRLTKLAGTLTTLLARPRTDLSLAHILLSRLDSGVQLLVAACRATLHILVRVWPTRLLILFLLEKLARMTWELILISWCCTDVLCMTRVQQDVPVASGGEVIRARRHGVFLTCRSLLEVNRFVEIATVLVGLFWVHKLRMTWHMVRRVGAQKLLLCRCLMVLVTVLPSSTTVLSIYRLVVRLRGGICLKEVGVVGDTLRSTY